MNVTDAAKTLVVSRLIKAAERWDAQRTKARRAQSLGKARSRAALADRADELHLAVEALHNMDAAVATKKLEKKS